MPIAASMLMPISPLLAPAITGLDMRLQACFQGSRSTALEGQRQVTARIAACELTIGLSVSRQHLSRGEQLINLAIAKDLLRRDRGPRRRRPHEGAPVQGANGLEGISVAVGAQRV